MKIEFTQYLYINVFSYENTSRIKINMYSLIYPVTSYIYLLIYENSMKINMQRE